MLIISYNHSCKVFSLIRISIQTLNTIFNFSCFNFSKNLQNQTNNLIRETKGHLQQLGGAPTLSSKSEEVINNMATYLQREYDVFIRI